MSVTDEEKEEMKELIFMLDKDPTVDELESVTDEIIPSTVDGKEVYTAKNEQFGAASFGDTKEEAMENMAEALVLELKVTYMEDEFFGQD